MEMAISFCLPLSSISGSIERAPTGGAVETEMTVGQNNNMALEALIIGTSPATCRLREMIRRVARSNASVMLCGPSGSGKELVARAIHDEGARAGQCELQQGEGAEDGGDGKRQAAEDQQACRHDGDEGSDDLDDARVGLGELSQAL